MSAELELPPPVVREVAATRDIVALDLEGEFDIDAAPGLLDQAERVLAAGKNLIVNLSGATFIDSSIVHTLFQADEGAKKAGRVFILQFGTYAAVERVLSITGADKHLDTAPTRQEAVDLAERLSTERLSTERDDSRF